MSPRPPQVSQLHDPITVDWMSARSALSDRVSHRLAHASVRALLAARRANAADQGANIIAIGIGEKISDGERTGTLAVKVLVAAKVDRRELSRRDLIPASIDGMPTDVDAVGRARRFAGPNLARVRPVVGGLSISPSYAVAQGTRMAGTLGLIVHDRAGRRHVLSNNHVLAMENALGIGAEIVQPGTADAIGSANTIATLSHVEPLLFGNLPNRIDAAAARLATGVKASRRVAGIGTPTGTAKATINAHVRKAGRSTGVTEGIVRVVNADVMNVEYVGGVVRINDVIVIEGVGTPFSAEGDSGSAVIEQRGRVVGLMFGGTDTQTFAVPIARVLSRFRMSL